MLPRWLTRPEVVLAKGLSRTPSLTSPQWIAFTQGTRVYVARPDGRERRQVFDGHRRVACLPAWSPDGHTLYLSHDQILAIDVASGSRRAVTDFAPDARYSAIWFLSCSPDNKRLIFRQHLRGTSVSRLVTINTDGTGLRVLFEPPEGRIIWGVEVSWEHQLMVVLIPGPRVAWEWWTMDLEGGNPACVGGAPRVTGPHFALAPTGDRLACDSRGGISIIHLSSQERKQLTPFGWLPAWSPDGERLAFVREDCEFWIAPADGRTAPTKQAWVRGRCYPMEEKRGSWASRPVWSPDGRLLWFSLTKTSRCRPSPDSLKSVQEDLFLDLPEAQREDARQSFLESLHWEHSHWVGAADLARGEVCLLNEYWSEVAWAPQADGDHA